MGQTTFKLEFNKFRAKGDQSLAPRVFTLDGSKWHASEDDDDAATRLVRALQSCKFTTQEEAGRSLGINDKTKVSRLLSQAVAKGMIKKAVVKQCLEAARMNAVVDFEDAKPNEALNGNTSINADKPHRGEGFGPSDLDEEF